MANKTVEIIKKEEKKMIERAKKNTPVKKKGS